MLIKLDDFQIITIVIISYVLLLILLKRMGFKKKKAYDICNNCCPKCNESLDRIKRTLRDHLINYMTFMIFNFKKYKCSKCNWQGLRWDHIFPNY